MSLPHVARVARSVARNDFNRLEPAKPCVARVARKRSIRVARNDFNGLVMCCTCVARVARRAVRVARSVARNLSDALRLMPVNTLPG